MLFILFLAISIIIALAVIAVYYSLAWQKRKKELRIHYEREEKIIQDKRGEAKKSIRLIASAYLQGQVSATETAMRISRLSRAVNLDEKEQEIIKIFDKLSNETSHIPILNEWKKLSRKQQWEFDQSRFKIEQKYEDFIRSSAEKLVSEDFLI